MSVNIHGHHVGRTKEMIDLLRERLGKADGIIVQIERVLKYWQTEEQANRHGGCYCEDDEGGYHNHTGYCERANTLMNSARWYLKKTAEMPAMLKDEREMLMFGIRNAVAGTAHVTRLQAGTQSEEMIAAIALELEDLGFRREKLNVRGPG